MGCTQKDAPLCRRLWSQNAGAELPHLASNVNKLCHGIHDAPSQEDQPMATMNVSLPGPMKSWVEDNLKDGRFSNASVYVRHLIRRDQERAEAVQAIQRAIDDSANEETTDVDSPAGSLKCSTPERAILELLDELPRHQSVHIVDTAFEGLASARPRRLEKLLASCTSIKVKRLFFILADKHGHAWRRHLSPDRFDLGSGPRALFEKGQFHPQYGVSVPPELMPHREDENGA
jgi:putative addiction module CopG family antidote